MGQKVFTGIFAAGILREPLHMATFAENLKRIREQQRPKNKKMTQVDLAKICGLTQAAISKYETGEAVPELAALLKLATGLRVPLESLVEGEDVKFDAVYRDLRVSITDDRQAPSDEDRHEDIGAETAELPADVLPGAPEPSQVADEPNPKEVAAAHAAVHRALAQLVSAASRLPHGPVAVARDLGPDLRPRTARARKKPRPRTQARSAPKRR